MKRANVIVVLIGIAFASILTANASAMYNPTMGRFMQRDPLGYVDGANSYVAYECDPGTNLDATGLAAEDFKWKRLPDNIFEATEDGAPLTQISQLLLEEDASWQCIWPSSVKDETTATRLYSGKKAACGDKWDASNLQPASGGTSAHVIFVGGDLFSIAKAYSHFTDSAADASGLAAYFRDRSQQGRTPIGSAVVFSHGQVWSKQINNGTGSYFDIQNLNDAATVKPGKPDFAAANARKGPPRCWFGVGADVRFLGCRTSTFASTWSGSIARGHGPTHRSQTWGTTLNLTVTEQGGTLAGRLEIPRNFVPYEQIFEKPAWHKYYRP